MFKKTSDDSILVFDNAPAKTWYESYPIGNGSLGGMVYGRTDTEIIALNHDTLWSGYPKNDKYCGKGVPALNEIKAAVKAGNYALADEIHKKSFAGYPVSAYMPLGELKIEYLNDGKISGYKRFLDLSKAACVTQYKKGKRQLESMAFSSHPDNVLVYKTTAAGEPFDFKLTASSKLLSRSYADGNVLYLDGECPKTFEYGEKNEERGVCFTAAFYVVTDGVAKDNTFRDNSITYTGATEFTVFTVVRPSFNGYENHPYLNGKDYKSEIKAAIEEIKTKDFDGIFKRHLADYGKYFKRVKINLGSDKRASVTTEKRLIDYQNGVSDKALSTLIFNFGRYLTIAASRNGSQAMNLQGIWNNDYCPPWKSDYTVNINTEMNYYPTLAIGLKEMYQPLLALIKELSVAGKITAKMLYGADGWVCHHNTDLWRATQPVAGFAVYSFWNAAGGWLCRHIYEYYEYTLDKRFLEKEGYPILKSAAEFYLSQLTDSDDEYRIIFPSTSPENRFKVGESSVASISETTEMTMSIVRELFGNILKASEILGIKDDFTARIESEKKRLRPPMVGQDGRLLEWYKDMPEQDVHHRHVSHLYALYPGEEVSPEKTPELAEAYKKSLVTRGSDGTGWSIIWKSALYARLYDGDGALNQLKALLKLSRAYSISMTGGGVYSSLLCSHPPFQIDGNFGATAAICEMLMQSDPDTIRLIPALPSEWSDISVCGLCAKGRRVVSLTVKNGILTHCIIKGTLPESVILNGEDMKDSFVFNGKAFEFIRR